VTGKRYDDNYDALLLDPATPIAAVADGMGDGPGSALASHRTAQVFGREAAGADSPAALRAVVSQIQVSVRRDGRDLHELTGCTLTAFTTDDDAAWIVQLGDSRAYRLRDGLLELLTVDHTVAWLGILHGWFPVDSDEANAARHRLTRYIGHPDAPEPDVMSVTLRPGDVYLLCTDGVSDQLSYERLTQILSSTTADDPAAAAHILLDETIEAGGEDNATAVVIRVEQTV
jgi:serine/threonine protein phosphatase PrpC